MAIADVISPVSALDIAQVKRKLTVYDINMSNFTLKNREVFIHYCNSCRKLYLDENAASNCRHWDRDIRENISNEIKRSDIISFVVGCYYELDCDSANEGLSISRYELIYYVKAGRLVKEELNLAGTLIYNYQTKFFKCISIKGEEEKIEDFFMGKYPDLHVEYIRKNAFPTTHIFNLCIKDYIIRRNRLDIDIIETCRNTWTRTGLEVYYKYLMDSRNSINNNYDAEAQFNCMQLICQVNQNYSILEKLVKSKYKMFVTPLLNGITKKLWKTCSYHKGNIAINEFFNTDTQKVNKLMQLCFSNSTKDNMYCMMNYIMAEKFYDICRFKDLYELVTVYDHKYLDRVRDILQELSGLGYKNTPKLLKYIESQSDESEDDRANLIRLRDYVRMCKEYDMHMHEYPNNLRYSHDEAARCVRYLQNKRTYIMYENRLPEITKDYEYSDEKYSIVVPKSIDDIVEEGERMNHCVASYTDRAARGDTTILFLRRNNNIDKVFVTIEVIDHKLMQVKCFDDDRLTEDEAIEFIKKWCREKHIKIVSMY